MFWPGDLSGDGGHRRADLRGMQRGSDEVCERRCTGSLVHCTDGILAHHEMRFRVSLSLDQRAPEKLALGSTVMRKGRVRLILGLATGVFLLGVSIALEIATPRSGGLTPPITPSDRSSGRAAIWWRFLDEAREHLPEGATFTVMASDSTTEMRLFMIALGLYPDHEILPTSYFGDPLPSVSCRAEYVLAFKRARPGGKTKLVARLHHGRVYRRVVTSQ